jgi:hypothetical protein
MNTSKNFHTINYPIDNIIFCFKIMLCFRAALYKFMSVLHEDGLFLSITFRLQSVMKIGFVSTCFCLNFIINFYFVNVVYLAFNLLRKFL